jgi:hypothetical protein
MLLPAWLLHDRPACSCWMLYYDLLLLPRWLLDDDRVLLLLLLPCWLLQEKLLLLLLPGWH